MSSTPSSLALFTALKVLWKSERLLEKLPGGAKLGEIEGTIRRPYVSVVPLDESLVMTTNKGKYEAPIFEVGVVVSDPDQLKTYAAMVRAATEDKDVELDLSGDGLRLFKIRWTDGRYEEVENFWIYWQEFSCFVAR